MDLFTCPQRAEQALERAQYPTRKLILIHTAVLLGTGLILSLFSYLLSLGIGGTGGLGGLSDRAFLETLQSLLQLAYRLLTPFWAIGLTAASLRMSRGQALGPETLLEGFRRFGPVLRLNILRAILYFMVIMIAVQLASTVYMLTPFAKELQQLAEQMVASGTEDMLAVVTEEALMSITMKMLPFLLGACLLLLVPLFYRMRMMDYILVDNPQMGAFFAMRLSGFMMRKNCWKLFRLDLKFWWFYVLEGLTLTVCYGDILLSWVGVALPGSAALWSFGFYLAGVLSQLGLYWWKKDLLVTAYALAYQELLPRPVEKE